MQGGFLAPNEPRALENLPPQEGGDQLLINGSYVPINQAGAAYKKGGEGTGQGEEIDGSEGNKSDSDNT
ncbi:hypothetical protein D3C73_1542310 [compost metagenome]